MEEYDIVYGNTILNFWANELGKILNIPTILAIHESLDYKSYFSNYPNHLSKEGIKSFREASKVVFVAKATEKLYYDLNSCNFQVIKNAINLLDIEKYIISNSRKNLREIHGVNEKDIVITIVGTICHRKGQAIFLEAAYNLLNKNLDCNLHFFIVGGKDELYYQELTKYVNDNDMKEKVSFYTDCSNVYQFYLISNIFVCASYEESSPAVILESMAFKVPIVSTNVFGIPEMITDKKEALLIEPGKSDLLTEKLEELISDNRLKERLVNAAYHRILREFSKDRFIDEYDNCFKEAFLQGRNTSTSYNQ